jgi:hypothetical protein
VIVLNRMNKNDWLIDWLIIHFIIHHVWIGVRVTVRCFIGAKHLSIIYLMLKSLLCDIVSIKCVIKYCVIVLNRMNKNDWLIDWLIIHFIIHHVWIGVRVTVRCFIGAKHLSIIYLMLKSLLCDIVSIKCVIKYCVIVLNRMNKNDWLIDWLIIHFIIHHVWIGVRWPFVVSLAQNIYPSSISCWNHCCVILCR